MKPVRDWAPANEELEKRYTRAVQISKGNLWALWRLGFCEQFKGGQLQFFCASHLALQAAAWEARGWRFCCIMSLDFWFLAFSKETLRGSCHPWSKEEQIQESPCSGVAVTCSSSLWDWAGSCGPISGRVVVCWLFFFLGLNNRERMKNLKTFLFHQ